MYILGLIDPALWSAHDVAYRVCPLGRDEIKWSAL